MCLAIPGQIVSLGPEPHLAVVAISKVRRQVNVDLLQDESLAIGEWVLIHVGFAMAKISDREAVEQLRLLAMLGQDEEAMRELEGYQFE
jgi:hydrogenase expression/formation protein HypC